MRCRTLWCLLVLALATLEAGSARAQPKVTTVTGVIESVDAPAGRVALRAPEGTLREFEAPTALLSRLQAGEVVEVMMAGPNAMILRKQPPDAPAAPAPPVDTPVPPPPADRR